MNISSIVTANGHPKSIIASLKSTNGLPFREVLSPEVIAGCIHVPYREWYDFYSPEITLWAFLSQALDADHSLDAAVKRVIAFHLSIGHEYDISSNTAAFSKARSKLPEEVISNLAHDSAEKMEEDIPVSWLWNKLHLGKKDHIAKWIKPKKPTWMDQKTYDSFPAEIDVREVMIQSNKKGFRSEQRILVTTFLYPQFMSSNQLATLYSCRWWIELDLRSLKQIMHMDILRGKSPEMVRKEIWVHILAYNLIRKIIAQAAYAHDKKPRELSFRGALDAVKAFRERGILTEKKNLKYLKKHYYPILQSS